MSQILMYSRPGKNQLNASVELISRKLAEIGHLTEQTHSTNWARIFLNPYDLVHLFVEQLPLTVNELLFLSLMKTLGKPCILSLFNTEPKQTKSFSVWLCPDAMTFSQSNHFQYYRDWTCSKSLLPLFPEIKKSAISGLTSKNRSFLIPLEKNLEEAFRYKTDCEIYFDARSLAKSHSPTQLRKQWNQFLKDKKLHSLAHLILSEEKLNSLLQGESLQIVLASPTMKHTEFTTWLEKTLNQNHLILLNEFQATGFSQSWTSGQNCYALSTHHWPKSLNHFLAATPDTSKMSSHFKSSELAEPLINELSRLYTKILRQKTTLISEGSVKIKS